MQLVLNTPRFFKRGSFFVKPFQYTGMNRKN